MRSQVPEITHDALIDNCLSVLRSLGPAVQATLARKNADGDGTLHLALNGDGLYELGVRTTRTHLSYALAAGLIEQMRSVGGEQILFCPYVATKMGAHLAGHGINYVDEVGNCHVVVGTPPRLLAHVEGKKPRHVPHATRGARVPGHQLAFAVLAKPSLLEQPVRDIAATAGIGKTTAASQLRRLVDEGVVERTRRSVILARPQELLDRWLGAYADIVRPAWLRGRYRTRAKGPEELEKHLESVWQGHRWVFGGGAAAWRMANFYRGLDTVVHVETMTSEILREIRALPADDGPLIVLETPGNVAYDGQSPRTAHPLLVYSELMVSRDPRMREAGTDLRRQFLNHEP